MAEVVRAGITEDELMKLPSDARVEVIDGEMVEMSPVGVLHHLVVSNFIRILDAFVLANGLGLVFPDGLIYLLNKELQHLRGARVPDVSFIHKDSIPPDLDLERPFPGAPTLAIEVMSPDDTAIDLQKRIADYFAAGTAQVWVAYADTRQVHQHRRGADTIRVYQGDDAIEADDLFPGLRLPLADVFRLPPWVKAE